jgi:hypothetical protein
MFGFGVIVPCRMRSMMRPETVGWAAEGVVGLRQPVPLRPPDVQADQQLEDLHAQADR